MVSNLKSLEKEFDTEEKCRNFLIKQRWDGKPECPYCGNKERIYNIEKGKRFKCGNSACYKKFSVTVGTIFEASNIPLTLWFKAMYFITANKRGVNSVQLAKYLGITQKSSWFLIHRIREALKEKGSLLLCNTVQADETYIGGREGNKHKDKKATNTTTIADKKTPVVGLQETAGKVVLNVMPWVTKKNVGELIRNHLDSNAILVTDAAACYTRVGKRYDHQVVNHLQGEFMVNGFHTNGIENFWSVFKRMLYGTYIQVSPKHLQRYCDESAFRFNTRKLPDGERLNVAFSKISGRLSYKTLVNGQKNTEEGGEEDIKFEETLW